MAEVRKVAAGNGAAAKSRPARGSGAADGGERVAPRLRARYGEEIRPALMSEFSYRNVMEAPRLEKIVVNIGIGEAKDNARALDAAVGDLAAITASGRSRKRPRSQSPSSASARGRRSG